MERLPPNRAVSKRIFHSSALALLCLCASGLALGHSFGRVYNLPVPVWLYLYGAAATLALSFLVVGLFLGRHSSEHRIGYWAVGHSRLFNYARYLKRPLQAASVTALLLCVATGLWGTPNPYGNFNMSFFWIGFVLAFAWFSALIVNLYPWLNPWLLLANIGVRLLRWIRPSAPLKARFNYPARLGYWPAFFLYIGFIWYELLGGSKPASLAYGLIAYTLFNLCGAALFGRKDWFSKVEFFGLFMQLFGKMAILQYCPIQAQQHQKRAAQTDAEHTSTEQSKAEHWRLYLPFAACLNSRPQQLSVLLFLLFMLSSTAFDGLHETLVWMRIFWGDLFPALQPWVGSNLMAAYPTMLKLLQYWQAAWLALSPLLYLSAYLLFVYLMKLITRRPESLMQLALRFAYTLLPIAFVYHFTHYYTLLQTQGLEMLRIISDPFGRGWDIFGSADWRNLALIPKAETVWHVQVGLIVFGHVVSVYLAHIEALRLYQHRSMAVLSQLPMLVLMVLFTVAGLWILSQPIQSGL